MRRHILLIITFIHALTVCFAQGYDEDRINLSMFVERMFNNEPFEGCRIIDDYDNSYLLSVVMLEENKYPNKMAMNRVAQVKSQRSAGEFFNGAQSYSELVIKTPKSEEKGGSPNMVETIEVIKVNSIGFVRQMQLLTSFAGDDNMKVFVFYKEIGKNSLE